MIIDKMKTLDHLTIQEKYLVDYIINNQEDILKKNINELAKLSYTSSATISRLCKKLGFNGYKEFKYQYAAEYSHLLELKNDFKIEPFSSESSIDDALNKIELLHKRAIEYTKSLLDRQVIEEYDKFQKSDKKLWQDYKLEDKDILVINKNVLGNFYLLTKDKNIKSIFAKKIKTKEDKINIEIKAKEK